MEIKMVDITGVDKYELMSALHTASHPLGMGFLHEAGPLSVDDCKKIISKEMPVFDYYGDKKEPFRFDYLRGRVMKCDINGDEVDPWGYDRDNGDGAMERVVAKVKKLSTSDL